MAQLQSTLRVLLWLFALSLLTAGRSFGEDFLVLKDGRKWYPHYEPRPVEVATSLGPLRFSLPPAAGMYRDKVTMGEEALSNLKPNLSEWDYESVAIADRVLPFDSCVAQLESYNRLLRVYVIQRDPKEIERSILGLRDIEPAALFVRRKDYRTHGIAAQYSNCFKIEQELSSSWRKTTVVHSVRYGDYGGDSQVDIRVKELGTHALVFAFMGRANKRSGSVTSNLLETVAIIPADEVGRSSDQEE